MLLTSLLAFTTSLLFPIVAASSTPDCVSSNSGYATSDITILYKDFCSVLEKNNFTSDVQLYGIFIVSFGFTLASNVTVCDVNNCLSSYLSMVESCKLNLSLLCYVLTAQKYKNKKLTRYIGQLNSHYIYGTASLDAGCGVYNFSILDTLPSSAAPSATELSVSLLIPPSTSTSGSATETSKASTTTKPSVGSTALGTSDAGAGIRKVSLFTLALVGCVFVFFL
jgi:hypothetical protein